MAEDDAMVYPNSQTRGLDQRDPAAMPLSQINDPGMGPGMTQTPGTFAAGAGFRPAPDLVPNAQFQAPQYLGFEHLFRTMFPKIDAHLDRSAADLFQTLNALYSDGRGGFHQAAYQYDFGEFVRDVAVVAASRMQKASDTSAPRTGVAMPNPKPAPKSTTASAGTNRTQ